MASTESGRRVYDDTLADRGLERGLFIGIGEIGRASCRGRGEISGGAGSFKKKKERVGGGRVVGNKGEKEETVEGGVEEVQDVGWRDEDVVIREPVEVCQNEVVIELAPYQCM